MSLQDAAHTVTLEIGLANISQSSKSKNHDESHGSETLNVFVFRSAELSNYLLPYQEFTANTTMIREKTHGC